MDVMEAIRGRRTIHGFRPDPVSQEQIEQMLEAAIWAPNHRLTNPWEFYVVRGEAKAKLARLRGELKRLRHAEPESEAARKLGAKSEQNLAAASCAILVCQRLEGSPAQQEEGLLSVGCAIQNLMLAAHGMGIGTFWGTGPVINHPETFALLGVPEGQKGVGLILVGYPAANEIPVPPRVPARSKTHWVE